MQEILETYNASLLALALLTLTVLVQGFVAIRFTLFSGVSKPGMAVPGDHSDRHWRVYRAHQNSLEDLPTFAAGLLVAVLVGANPTWVALLAWIHVAARCAHWYIYFLALGTKGSAPRTIAFVVGFFTSILMALTAVFGVLI